MSPNEGVATSPCFDLRPGQAKLRLRHSERGGFLFEAWRVVPDIEFEELVAVFKCTLDDAKSIYKGGAVVLTVADGHLMARRYEDTVWFVCAVPSRNYAESCMVPMAAYQAAVARAVE